MVDTIAGYRLESLLGRGSTGTVWLARRDGRLARVVAVKRVVPADPDAVDALRREGEILARLDHPHVVDLLEAHFEPLLPPSFALELEGFSFGADDDVALLVIRGQVVAVLAPIADALASAHRRGVVHGDVKPANVLFTSDGEPVLSDFGVARHLGAPAVIHLPVRGTATYLDPALLGGAPPGGAGDVYALAVVAYEALTGRPPHRGTDAEVLAAADAAAHEPLCANPSVPADLAAIVDAALSRDPRRRPTAGELSAGLRASLDPAEVALPGPAVRHPVEATGVGTRVFGPRPPAPPPSPTSGRRWSVVVAAVAVTVAALVVGGGWWVQHDATSAGPDRDAGRAAVEHRSTLEGGRSCPSDATPGIDAGRDLPRVDLDGDGCPDDSSWDGRLLVTRLSGDGDRLRAFRVGRVGDRVVLGDWDCDGIASPALYRPGTGEVRYASHLASHVGDRVYAARVEWRAPGGVPRRVARSDGCDEVRIGPTGPISVVGR